MKLLFAGLLLLTPALVQGAVFTAFGATPGSIQTAVDDFRSALGANNGVGGSFVSGRREINWDGVPDGFAAPNLLPADFFNVNSPRGAVFSGASGFQVSADASNVAAEPTLFGGANATYPSQFQTFSAERLFRSLGSNTFEISFFIPGTNTPTSVLGFGAVFTDVELAAGTLFTVFYANGNNGGQFAVPTSASGGLSFLGLTDPTNRYSRIIIQSGTATPGATENLTNNIDVVAMDDFIYGEPFNPNATSNAVPEPGTWLLSAAGLLAATIARRKR